jgi:hypothetical protein
MTFSGIWNLIWSNNFKNFFLQNLLHFLWINSVAKPTSNLPHCDIICFFCQKCLLNKFSAHVLDLLLHYKPDTKRLWSLNNIFILNENFVTQLYRRIYNLLFNGAMFNKFLSKFLWLLDERLFIYASYKEFNKDIVNILVLKYSEPP